MLVVLYLGVRLGIPRADQIIKNENSGFAITSIEDEMRKEQLQGSECTLNVPGKPRRGYSCRGNALKAMNDLIANNAKRR